MEQFQVFFRIFFVTLCNREKCSSLIFNAYNMLTTQKRGYGQVTVTP